MKSTWKVEAWSATAWSVYHWSYGHWVHMDTFRTPKQAADYVAAAQDQPVP